MKESETSFRTVSPSRHTTSYRQRRIDVLQTLKRRRVSTGKYQSRLVLKHQCTFLKTTFFTGHLQQLLLTVSGFQPATLLKKKLRQRCLSVNFANILRTSFDRTPLDDGFLCLSVVNFTKFFRSFLLQSTSGKLLALFTSCRISTTTYSKKVFHNCFSSILYKTKKQLLECVYVLKIPENYLWRS